jgi:hypothetical protein
MSSPNLEYDITNLTAEQTEKLGKQLAEALSGTDASQKPDVMQPGNLFAAYKQFKEHFCGERKWREWYEDINTERVNKNLFQKCKPTYHFIDTFVENELATVEQVVEGITAVANSYKCHTGTFVKTYMFDYLTRKSSEESRIQMATALSKAIGVDFLQSSPFL